MPMWTYYLVPVYEVFHVYEPISCEKCGKVIGEAKELTRITWSESR